APILNSKILSGCRWDAHHPLKPLSRLLKAIVRKARPICHCDRVTEDRVKRRKVVLSSATEAKPFGSYFGHGRTDFGGNSVSFPLKAAATAFDLKLPLAPERTGLIDPELDRALGEY